MTMRMGTVSNPSSSLVVRATMNTYLVSLIFCIVSLIKPIRSGFSPINSPESPDWQYQQQLYPQFNPPHPGAYYHQQARPRDVSNIKPTSSPNDYQPQHVIGHNPGLLEWNNPTLQHNYYQPNYQPQPRIYPVQLEIPKHGPGTGEKLPPSAVPVVPIPSALSSKPQVNGQQKFKPSKSDPCGAINISEMHGYQVREYKVQTKDNYELVIHRLIHPAEVKRMIDDNLGPNGEPLDEKKLRLIEPKLGNKKPYLLLHGLVGSSASFVRNVDKLYQAPPEVYDVGPEMEAILRKRANENELNWQSSADKMNAAYSGDISNTLDSLTMTQRLTSSFKRRTFARTNLIDFYGDRLNFAYEFTQAFRKFSLPRESMKNVPNSLAFTLSNFGYDVWMVNLRGNEYSRGFNGPLNRKVAEYWDFDLDRLIKEDLLAGINKIKKTIGRQDNNDTIGIVSYSYSSLHILGLLTKFPQYQKTLQPVIMMAPTLLSSSDKSSKLKFIIKNASKLLISQTGPFPNRAESKKKLSIESIVCKLPVASKLCNLMTMILNGKTSSVKGIIKDDREQSLMLLDAQCGQTSTGVLHQIVENISHHAIMPKYTPFVGARSRLESGDLRRSIMIIRSQADEIANEAEINRIKEAAIKGMALSEVVIEEPKFGHTDFLFSKKNQYLVNAEVARMALVFDHVSQLERANLKVDVLRG